MTTVHYGRRYDIGKYQIKSRTPKTHIVTDPSDRASARTPLYERGAFRDYRDAILFIHALELADAGAPIGEDDD